MIPAKICGITSLKDAQLAIDCGAAALGIIFYNKSPRCVDLKDVASWIGEISNKIKTVGVFVNEKIEIVQSISNLLQLDYVQLHGDENPEYCRQMIRPVIKVFRVDKHVDNLNIMKYNVEAVLLDSYKKGFPGGTGNVFNWDLASDFRVDVPIILSGGLNIKNIKKGIKIINPDAVDINSGVEFSPGKKDAKKMKNIFKILNNMAGTSKFFNNATINSNDEI